MASEEEDPRIDPAGAGAAGGRRRRSSLHVRNRIREEQTARKLQDMELQVKRMFMIAAGDVDLVDAKRPGEAEEAENAELVSSMQETNIGHDKTIQELQRKILEAERRNECVMEEAEKWERKLHRTKKNNQILTQKIESKALEKLQSRFDPPDAAGGVAEAVDWKGRHDWLASKSGYLVKENGQLVAKRQQLEENEKNHKEELEQMEDMQEENDALHESMEEAGRLSAEMSEKEANFDEAHRKTVKNYEEKLAGQNDQFTRAALSRSEISTELNALKEENTILRREFEECRKQYHQKLAELDAAKDPREKNGRLRAELEEARMAEDIYEQELAELAAKRDDAYKICEVLQREVNELHETMEELRGDKCEGLHLHARGSTKERYEKFKGQLTPILNEGGVAKQA